MSDELTDEQMREAGEAAEATLPPGWKVCLFAMKPVGKDMAYHYASRVHPTIAIRMISSWLQSMVH